MNVSWVVRVSVNSAWVFPHCLEPAESPLGHSSHPFYLWNPVFRTVSMADHLEFQVSIVLCSLSMATESFCTV